MITTISLMFGTIAVQVGTSEGCVRSQAELERACHEPRAGVSISRKDQQGRDSLDNNIRLET